MYDRRVYFKQGIGYDGNVFKPFDAHVHIILYLCGNVTGDKRKDTYHYKLISHFIDFNVIECYLVFK